LKLNAISSADPSTSIQPIVDNEKHALDSLILHSYFKEMTPEGVL